MVETLHLFEPLDAHLLTLLRGLSREQWGRPTVAGTWTVRDVAAHLLDTPLRRLAFVRDGWPPQVRITDDADLVAFVNGLNADGVRTYGRLSPAILIDLMAWATAELRAHLRQSDLMAPAAFPVSWAGDASSPHWFDAAREYTERWHHQAQIRLAIGESPPAAIGEPQLYAPVVATFMRAVPHALRAVEARDGTRVGVVVEGAGGGTWAVARHSGGWHLDASAPTEPREDAARVCIPAEIAWRVFTKGMPAEHVAARCRVTGDIALGAAVLSARAIVG